MIDTTCDQLIEIEEESEIAYLTDSKLFHGNYFVIGGGSNVLFTKPFQGTLIKMMTKGIHLVDDSDDSAILEVSAGVEWSDFVNYCIEHCYYGVENLIGIPGLVGSCPVQNIGAYGAEVKDVIDSVFGYRISTQSAFAFSNKDCNFGYRNSIFKTKLKNDTIITRVRFKLSKNARFNLSYKGLTSELQSKNIKPTLAGIAETITSVRNAKLPDLKNYGCAGSFFKNPIVTKNKCQKLLADIPTLISYPVDDELVKLAAGQLIDLAGMKGVRICDAGVWPLQALVLVNYGNATGTDIMELCKHVQEKVFELTGIILEPEVNIL